MSYVTVDPQLLVTAATDLKGIGSALSAATSAAAAQTTAVAAAAADEISTQIAALFGAHGQAYQAASAQAAALHDQFVRTMTAGAGAYASAEAAAASPLQPLLDAINAPTQTLLGRPLIGNGANGAPGTGANGG
ncbi:PE family protein, partial [Mycobacterium riyadhense]